MEAEEVKAKIEVMLKRHGIENNGYPVNADLAINRHNRLSRLSHRSRFPHYFSALSG